MLMTTTLRFEVLGRCTVLAAGRRIEPTAELVYAALLVLGLSERHRWSRTDFAALLWPDAAYSTRGTRLRWLLAKLRSLGIPIGPSATEVTLAAATVVLDVDDLPSVDLATVGPILPGYSPAFSAAFADWVDERRSLLSAVALRGLRVRLQSAVQAGDEPQAIAVASAILRIEPTADAAALALAGSLVRTGARGEAVVHLEHFLNRLDDDTRTASHEVNALLARLRSAATAGRASDPRFVGRHDELRRIDALLQRTRNGTGGAIALTGPAGIGKTRLLDEARIRAELAGMQVVRIRCQRGQAVRALAGVVDLVPQLLELRGAAGCDPENLARLQRVAQVSRSPAASSTDTTNPALKRSQLTHALYDVMEAVSEESALLIQVDDTQWADPGLNWLWDEMLVWSASHPVCWIFSHRTSRGDHFTLGAQQVAVGSLDTRSANDLLDDIARRIDRRLDEASREALLARGAGSPLFLRELTRQWSASGNCSELPGSLLTIFDAGLASLSRYALRTLQVAAVLDTFASLERIEGVAALPRAKFVDAIADLEAVGILAADASGATYGHVLWSEAALSRLSQNVARIIHRHAAECLSAEMANEPSLSTLWQCARHWDAAGQPDRAQECLVQGAEHLMENGFLDDALTTYSRIAAQTIDPAKRLVFLACRIRILRLLARLAEVETSINEHESLAVELDPAYDEHNDFEIEMLSSRFRRGCDTDILRECTLSCVLSERASSGHRLRAAKECMKVSELTSPETARLVLKIAESLPRNSPEEVWDGEIIRTLYHRRLGDVAMSVEIASRLSRIEPENASREPDALCLWAMCLSTAGRIDEARELYRRSIDCALRRGMIDKIIMPYDHYIGMSLDFDLPSTTRRIIGGARATLASLAGGTKTLLNSLILPSHEAQLAAMSGDPRSALQHAVPLARARALRPPRWRARLVAIHLSAAEQLGDLALARELQPIVGECLQEEDFWLDWPACVYAASLQRADSEAASRFAIHYVSKVRRELYAPPALLAQLAQNNCGRVNENIAKSRRQKQRGAAMAAPRTSSSDNAGF